MTFLLYFCSLVIGVYFTKFSIISTLTFAAYLGYISFKLKKKVWSQLICVAIGITLSLSVFTYYQSNLPASFLVVKAEKNYLIVQSFFKKYYLAMNNNDFELFDIIKINGGKIDSLQMHAIESQFDFKEYLNNDHVFMEIKTNEIVRVFTNPIKIKAFSTYVLSGLDEKTRAVVSLQLFNDYGDAEAIFTGGEYLYLIAISSIHYYYLESLLTKFFKHFMPRHVDIMVVISMIPFLFLSSFKMGIVRIFLLRLILFANKFYYRELNRLEATSVVGILFVIVNPHVIYQTSFLFSFPLLIFLNFARSSFSSVHQFLRSIFSTFIISLFLLPMNAYLNFEVSLVTFIFRPIMAVFSLGSFVLSFMTIFKIFNVPISVFMCGFVDINNFLSGLDLVLVCGETTTAFIIIFYITLLAFLLSCELNFTKGKIGAGVFLTATLLLSTLNFSPNKSFISFIDVGQGDATLITDGKTTFLVDTGGSKYVDIATISLIKYFKKLKISTLDFVLTTHDDFDHIGALPTLVSKFNVNNIYDHNINMLKIGAFTINNLNYGCIGDANLCSGVYDITYEKRKILIMGDAPASIEKKIIEEYPLLTNIDYLKIGHHGSNTSSSYEFLSKINPQRAIISCGYNNFYGHPHQDVINRLEHLKINYYRTDLSSTVSFEI